jgi:hypothetical protein
MLKVIPATVYDESTKSGLRHVTSQIPRKDSSIFNKNWVERPDEGGCFSVPPGMLEPL